MRRGEARGTLPVTGGCGSLACCTSSAIAADDGLLPSLCFVVGFRRSASSRLMALARRAGGNAPPPATCPPRGATRKGCGCFRGSKPPPAPPPPARRCAAHGRGLDVELGRTLLLRREAGDAVRLPLRLACPLNAEVDDGELPRSPTGLDGRLASLVVVAPVVGASLDAMRARGTGTGTGDTAPGDGDDPCIPAARVTSTRGDGTCISVSRTHTYARESCCEHCLHNLAPPYAVGGCSLFVPALLPRELAHANRRCRTTSSSAASFSMRMRSMSTRAHMLKLPHGVWACVANKNLCRCRVLMC